MTRRAAFTLIELLIVAAIFALLFGMVLAVTRPSVAGGVRQAAQNIASVLLATQSKALGNPSGAGVILDSSSGVTASTVSAADMLPPITGVCSTGMPPVILSATSAAVSITPTNADPSELIKGYKIRFRKAGTLVQPPTAWMRFDGPETVSFRGSNGQTSGAAGNTIWPAGSGTFAVTIARYPNKGEAVYELPRTVAIDLRYSGVGDGGTFDPNWSDLSNKGSIAIAFDSAGEVDVVIQQAAVPSNSVPPLHPVSPVYLLVASKADVDANTSLTSQQSAWVVVQPQTGRVSVSSNAPSTASDPKERLREARDNARKGLPVGR
jgi:prepilin-type N-terminal cleavage/methylation domain-containing protein